MAWILVFLDIHHNLFYDVDYSIYYRNKYAEGYRIYSNVSLAIPTGGAFYYYRQAESEIDDNGSDHGIHYNNVIDGQGYVPGDIVGCYDPVNLPDTVYYNLWSDAADRTLDDHWDDDGPLGWFTNETTNATLGITYDAGSMTVTAADDYPGRGTGSGGANIGGFAWSVEYHSRGTFLLGQ